MKFRATAVEFFEQRNKAMGERLKSFKAKGLLKGATISWLAGAYTLKWAESGRLHSIKHTNGDIIEIDEPDCPVTRTWALEQNWLDYGAFVVKEPMPRYYLHDFFKKAQSGPYALTYYTGKSKPLERDILAIHSALETKRSAEADIAAPNTEVVRKLESHASAKRKQALEGARERARASLQAKKKARTVTLAS